jgi:acyl-CoA synthetase (AMP-forming)/AMP-acid ligase II
LFDLTGRAERPVEEDRPVDQHLATIWEAISDAVPTEIALQHGRRETSWGDFERRAARFAAAMLAAGVRPGDTVAVDLYNCSEYLEVFFAALKIRAVPANVNHRYLGEELHLLLAQLDAIVLVHPASLRERVAGPVAATAGLRLIVEVGSAGGVPAGTHGYEDLISAHEPADRVRRPPEDSFLSCTGGTTGLPKAVEYVIAHSVANTRILGRQMLGLDEVDWDAPAVDRALELHRRGLSPVALPASPLMHSTGLIMASLPVLTAGGRVVTLTSRRFDAEELFTTAERARPRTVSIVGDAFARPMLRELDRRAAEGRRYDTTSLVTITSAGTAWSAEVKLALLEHIPQVTLVDACGSSEGATIGTSRVRRGMTPSTDRFTPAPGLRIIRPDGTAVQPGGDELGMFLVPTVARGYRDDPERTAATFRMVDGRMHVLTGDWGRWNPDGTITLVGRGTSTINTGGEKVFPEEVEKVIRTVSGVDDCAVLGRPDERFGQSVAALVQLVEGSREDEEATAERVTATARGRLAGYKVPRTVVFGPVPRGPNGKLLHTEARRVLEDRLADPAG